MTKGEKAKEFFSCGYNCSQAVAMAFSNEMNISEKDVARMTIGFGGGMGRMREVCGAMSGITFVISTLFGEKDKGEIYKIIQGLAQKFKDVNGGSIICRELLGLSSKAELSPTPEKRTDEYYKKRPCKEIVISAADILDEYIKKEL